MKANLRFYQEHLSKEQLDKTLEEMKPNFFAYILHDKDTFPSGEVKKAHWHIVVEFETNSHKSVTQIISKYFTEEMTSGGHIEACRSMKASVEYLTHKNNLEKHQYDDNEVVTNDADMYEEYIQVQEKVGIAQMKFERVCQWYGAMIEKGLEFTKRQFLEILDKEHLTMYYLQNESKFDRYFIIMYPEGGFVC